MIAAGGDWDDPSEYNYYYENKLLYPMGSLAVMPGCTLFMYKDPDYTGTEYENHIKISDISISIFQNSNSGTQLQL